MSIRSSLWDNHWRINCWFRGRKIFFLYRCSYFTVHLEYINLVHKRCLQETSKNSQLNKFQCTPIRMRYAFSPSFCLLSLSLTLALTMKLFASENIWWPACNQCSDHCWFPFLGFYHSWLEFLWKKVISHITQLLNFKSTRLEHI